MVGDKMVRTKWSQLRNIKDTSTVDYWIRIRLTTCQNHCKLSNSRRVYGRAGRGEDKYLSKNLFKPELQNGECKIMGTLFTIAGLFVLLCMSSCVHDRIGLCYMGIQLLETQ